MPKKKRKDSATPARARASSWVDMSGFDKEPSATVSQVVVLDEQLTGAEEHFLRQAGITITSDSDHPALQADRNWLRVSAARLEAELRRWPGTRAMASGLDVPPGRLRRLAACGKVASARLSNGRLVYPVWQLREDRSLLPALREVLAAFPSDAHPLDIDHIMRSPDESLGGLTPREWLEQGRDPGDVLTLIDDHGWL
ncbi:hypothetical protein [Microbacterium sp. zg.Y1084]|uniref:hypothetical protein n=1 Tax=Microbacterium sp. zg.Y1084 TaxID=2969667 RepID=UPI00214C8C78|nr:hypothetical protein [Microbacterium sp. zg.Y1084]MCR2813032.1 hypothetical protein [Microbacterium sp. zg.Y1084]